MQPTYHKITQPAWSRESESESKICESAQLYAKATLDDPDVAARAVFERISMPAAEVVQYKPLPI